VFADPPAESGLHSLVGASGKPMTLADTDEDLEVHGRIGYGTNTPRVLGGLLLVVVLLIGGWSWLERQDSEEPEAPRDAPGFELALFNGETFRLEDHRGKVVVINFWASWCEPCQEEMPALQAAADEAGDDVVFVGVGAKTDTDDDAAAFAETYGVTYAIGRDTEGGDRVTGQIQLDYGVFAFPATYIVAPDGTISTVLMTPIDDKDDIVPLIDEARG
jgi:thiol-disulfide isomerase/thioredoxin